MEPLPPLARARGDSSASHMDSERNSDQEAEDELKKFFPTVHMKNVQILLYAAAIVIFILSIIQLILGSLTDDDSRRQSETVSGVLALLTSITCVYSSYAKDRGGLQLSYLLLIWLIANGAQTFFTGLGANNKYSGCDGDSSDTSTVATSSDCGRQSSVARGQSVNAAFLFLVSLGTAWLVSNFSEKIQDNMNNFQRERDIRFAIENQALKDRVTRRWKEAYDRVAHHGGGGHPEKERSMHSDPHGYAGHRALPPVDEGQGGPPPVPGKPHRRLPPVMDSHKEV